MSIDIVVYNASEIQLTDREAFTTVTQGLQWKGNGSMYLTLSSDGCKYPGSFNNCTAACLNPNVTFKDPQTLGNCVAYPWISRSISNGLLSILGQAVAEEFNIWSDTAYPQVTTAIVQIQNQCWNQWITHADSIFFSMDSPKWSEICGGDYSGVGSVNTDIGGVGISLSYWMQYSIAVGAFILLQCLDSWVYYSYLIGLRMIKGLSPKAAKKEAMDFQKKWIDRHLKILLMALVEFQKAQCFFILPVQAAALAALSGHTNILTPVNIKKVTEPVLLLRLVGINGILPVILILFTLHGAGQKSWYVFGLSTIALALSAATLFTASEPHLFDGYGIDSRYSACAYQDPSALCVNPDPVTYFPSLSFGLSGVLSITTLSLVVLAILTLDFLWNPEKPTMVPIRDWLIRCIDQRRHKHAIQPEQYKGKPIGSTRPKRFQLQLKRECVHNLVRVIYSLTYLVVWAFLLFYLAIGFLDWIFLDPVDGMLDTDLWSLGQIVAVTIWAAPLCEWVYLEFRGLEEGSKYRIPKPFKVVEEIDDEVTTQRPERVGSLPQSVARNLLSRLGCFRGSASANIAYDQTLNSTADDALRSMGTPASSNTVPNSHSRHSGSRKQPYGSQTQSSGHKRLRADPFEETVERKIARAVLKGHSEEGSFF